MARGKFIPPSPIVVVWDTETTGLDPADGAEIIEMAAIAIDTRKCPEYPEVARFPARLMRVTRPDLATAEALAVNGKTIEQIMAAEDPKTVLQEFLDWCGRVTGARHGTVRTMLGGHNTQFDVRFLKAALKMHLPHEDYDKHFDYHDLCSHKVFHFKHVMVSKRARFSKLQRAADMYGFKLEAHQAMGDVTGTVDLFRRMAAEEKQLDDYKTLAMALPHILYGSADYVDLGLLYVLVKKVFPTIDIDDELTFPKVFEEET